MRSPLLVLLLLTAPAARAQPGPFEVLDVTLAGFVSDPESSLANRWDVLPGALLRIEAPFYAGRVFVAGSAARYVAADAARSVPGYWAFHAFGGWAYAFRLPAGAELTPALHVGVFNWRFDLDDRYGDYNQAENELASGLDLRLSVPLRERWRLSLGVWTTRVLTSTRLDYRFAHAGLSWRFDTPRWIREGLQ
ncbi:MAG: hypothetical protein R3362_04960 [Rhodothermales bacterium]|nr:hypothetical protein [Rhodothermales bacterium]